MRILAEAGANVLSSHKDTGDNALHIAVELKHHNIVCMLVDSEYPLDICCQGGITALMIGARYVDELHTCEKLIEGGADFNKISDGGYSALSEAIKYENIELAKFLMIMGAQPFY